MSYLPEFFKLLKTGDFPIYFSRYVIVSKYEVRGNMSKRGNPVEDEASLVILNSGIEVSYGCKKHIG